MKVLQKEKLGVLAVQPENMDLAKQLSLDLKIYEVRTGMLRVN